MVTNSLYYLRVRSLVAGSAPNGREIMGVSSVRVLFCFVVVLVLTMTCLTGCTLRPGRTDLHAAARSSDVRGTAALLADGADANAGSYPQGITPLHVAVRAGSYQEAKLLVDNGADVNAEDWKRNTPLHEAVRGPYVDVARLLLDNGAHVDAKMYDLPSNQRDRCGRIIGAPPLNYCVTRGYEDMAAVLREYGADKQTGIWW